MLRGPGQEGLKVGPNPKDVDGVAFQDHATGAGFVPVHDVLALQQAPGLVALGEQVGNMGGKVEA